MFGRPRCGRCDSKVSKKYSYCPYCGFSLKEGNDAKFFEPIFKLGFPFNKMFKEIERQFQEIDSSMGSELDNGLNDFKGLSINIDTTSGQPTIRINANKTKPRRDALNPEDDKKFSRSNITEEQAERLSSLPREDPQTRVTRLSDRLLYEINLPGVNGKNLIINRLENSIEVKAFSENKAYFKLIPLSLPIVKSDLKEGKLTLELKI